MSATTNIDTRSTQRATRVLWGLGIAILTLLLIIPIVAWFVVDRTGRNYWSQIRAKLHADGEATALTELERPLIDSADENYGSIDILKDIASDAGEANRVTLEGMFPEGSIRLTFHLKPSPALPPVALADWADYLWTGAEREKAHSQLVQKRKNTKRLPDLKGNQGTPSERIENYLNHWDPTMSKLREGIYRKEAYFEPQIDSRNWDYPKFRSMAHLAPVRSAALACYLRALIAARSGDRETCLVHLETISRLAEACANEHDLTAYFYGSQMMLMVETGIVEGFRNRLWQNDSASIERCQSMLKRVNLREAIAPALRDYILCNVDFFAWLATPEGRRYPATWRYSSRKIERYFPGGWAANQQGIYAETANLHLFSALRANADLGEVIESAKRFDADLSRSSGSGHTLIALYKAMDGISFALISPAHSEAHRRQALIACAVELYRIEHDRLAPATLIELVPDYLNEIPTDPMDGAPMRYVRESPTTYQLWSIALDLIDDGGKLNLTPNRGQSFDPSFHNYTGDWPWPSDISAVE